MFNKSILRPFPTRHLNLWAMMWRCKCLWTCTCITLLDRYSSKFSGHRPLRNVIFSFCFVFLTHSCVFYSPHLTQTSGPLSTKRFLFLACIWHISAPRLALTSHVVSSIHHNTHTCSPDLNLRPPQFSCLYHTDLQASATIYPTHVLVCLRSFCYIHTAWMTFGPLSTVPTWGTACAMISWPHWSFV